MKKLKTLWIMIMSFGMMAGCASTHHKVNAHQDPLVLRNQADQDIQSNQFIDAIEKYEAITQYYPDSPEFSYAQIGLMYAYARRDQTPMAYQMATQYLTLFPRSPYADYVYYFRGLLSLHQKTPWYSSYIPLKPNYHQQESIQAFDDFYRCYQINPHGPYARLACQHMAKLRDWAASHELEVAQFYFDRGAYWASILRLDALLSQYGDTIHARSALEMMRLSYQAIGLTELSGSVIQPTVS